ncbi:MAG TPA: hypothetical protein VEZ46_02155 [Mycobacteriales bacterium]|nr:hypothetical protein [Mycobacteriales bacterium]
MDVYMRSPASPVFVLVDTVCITPGSPIVTAEQLAAAAQSAFTEDDVPVPTFAVQPNRPQVVLRKPVIGWITNHQTIDDPSFTEAYGIRIALRAYPEYHWDFDADGDSLGAALPPTRQPGAPYPSQDVSYTYAAKGDYRISVQAVWHGEFQIAGLAGWTTIAGTPTQTSLPHAVDVREARAVLYS